MKEAALTHAGIVDLERAVQYLSPAAMHRLCELLGVRHIVWIQKDLDNHLQVFSVKSGRISARPLKKAEASAS